jgi:hypothetical protein
MGAENHDSDSRKTDGTDNAETNVGGRPKENETIIIMWCKNVSPEPKYNTSTHNYGCGTVVIYRRCPFVCSVVCKCNVVADS